MQKTQDDVLAIAQPTQSRRLMALGAIVVLGGGVIYLSLTQPTPPVAKVMMIALGGAAFWGADGLRKATSGRVELTSEELRDGNGTRIAAVADVVAVERGVFAFKPSNGFLVRTQSQQPRGWRMGVWWRLGRRVGVGGMMPVGQTKFMAEQLATLIEKRGPLD